VAEHQSDRIVFTLESPHLDQGFPGNISIRVTYSIEGNATLSITYQALSDMDTICNMTNHSFFNLAGHDKPERAIRQELIVPGRTFVPSDAHNIPIGEDREVLGTPMDFRQGKPICQDIDKDYEYLQLPGGYDHTFEVFCEPCAILRDPLSGRTMSVVTDCPGIHLYSGNYLSGEAGKDGAHYPRRSGICLETHFYPDAIHNPHWKQPVIKAGVPYRSQTRFIFG
jgi:aldose 1-epimerase